MNRLTLKNFSRQTFALALQISRRGGWFWLLIFWGVSISAQEKPLTIELPNGGFVIFKLAVASTQNINFDYQTPTLPLASQVLIGDDNTVHRLVVDDKGKVVFGYDLRIEPDATARDFRVTARPLDAVFAAQLRARGTDLTNSAPPSIPTLARVGDSQIINHEKTFALDLLVNQHTQTKIVDLINLSFDNPNSSPAPRVLPVPRDFAVTNVELSVNNFQLRINNEAIEIANRARACRGSLVWFALPQPQRGRFIFSLVPRAGYEFQKVALLNHNRIEFTHGGTRYEWISETPIIETPGTWNLYVLHDKTFTPFFTPTIAASVDSPTSVTPQATISTLSRIRRTILGTTFEPRAPQTTFQLPTTTTKTPIVILSGGANEIRALLP